MLTRLLNESKYMGLFLPNCSFEMNKTTSCLLE